MTKRNLENCMAWLLALVCLIVLAEAPLLAQSQATMQSKGHHHYKLIDMGSLGGPGGGISYPSSRALNNRGMGVGASDTANPDPFAPDCYYDCNVVRGQLFRNGVVTELPPLSSAPNLSNIPAAINFWGQAVGSAQNGLVDSSTGWPESHGVLWQNGQAIEIPTLGGTQSIANDINDFGLVVGASLTATPDPFANTQLACGPLPTTCGTFSMTATFFPGTTESHAFLWHQGGFLRDLGTLGGPDSAAWVTNDLGEVAGWSFTSFVPNANTGAPTVDPFYWSPVTGKMTDLGGFGGTLGAAFWMNNRGQVVGASNLPGDRETHAFSWYQGKLTDLGTLGGGSSEAFSVNNSGEVVGASYFAFSWKDGVMRNLGTVDGDECSAAFSINSKSQIVGVSASCSTGADLHGFLGENGGPIVDLNALIVPASQLTVVTAIYVNDRGEIACLVQEADGSNNGCQLIPCDENHPGIVGCDYTMVEAGIAEAASIGAGHAAPVAQTMSAKPNLSNLTATQRTARIRAMTAVRRGLSGLR